MQKIYTALAQFNNFWELHNLWPHLQSHMCWVSVLLSVSLFNIMELLLDKSLMQPSKTSLP